MIQDPGFKNKTGGRILGIDYGTKRVGIAVSDPEGKFALPHSVMANTKSLVADIEALAKTNEIKTIVIGESHDYKDKANKIMPAVMKLKEGLEKKGFTVHLEPEFMTSVQAERLQGKNDLNDASAAAIILQSFLDRVE